MKININKDEVYELNFPDEITPDEFLEIYERFGNIAKLIKLSNQEKVIDTFKNQFNQRVRKPYILKNPLNPDKITQRCNTNPFLDTKEKILDLLQYAYHGSKEDKERICKLMGYSWSDINKRFHNLFKRFNFLPSEVGLTQIPNKFNKHLNLKIPDYIIQSHTGIFDENGKEQTEENKYDVGIVHYEVDNKYYCNPFVIPNNNKISKDLIKVTCDNCKRKLKKENENIK